MAILLVVGLSVCMLYPLPPRNRLSLLANGVFSGFFGVNLNHRFMLCLLYKEDEETKWQQQVVRLQKQQIYFP